MKPKTFEVQISRLKKAALLGVTGKPLTMGDIDMIRAGWNMRGEQDALIADRYDRETNSDMAFITKDERWMARRIAKEIRKL